MANRSIICRCAEPEHLCTYPWCNCPTRNGLWFWAVH
jgi:hypothetical protein